MADGGPERASMRLRKSIGVVIEDKHAFARFRGTVADISATGMRLLSDAYLPPLMQYAFAFKCTPPLVVRGEVRWVRAVAGDTFACGVLFVEMSEEKRRTLHTLLELEGRRVPAR